MPERTHTTRLKKTLLTQIPDLEAHKGKYEIMLPFRPKYGAGETLLDVKARDQESNAVVLIRSANIVRNKIFQKQYKFTGPLTDEHYYDKPASLTGLVLMILGGTKIQAQTENNHVVKTAALSMSDLLTFNAGKCSRKESISPLTSHSIERETGLPLHIGLLPDNKPRKRDFIDILFVKRLIKVSYDLILQLKADVAISAITSFEQSGVVCPTVPIPLHNR